MLTHRFLSLKIHKIPFSLRLLSTSHQFNQPLAKKKEKPLTPETKSETPLSTLSFTNVGVSHPKEHIKNYMALAKNRLSYFVVFTANAGYCIATDPGITTFDYTQFWLGLTLGTYLCSASANSFNQIFEVPYDSQMTRTQTRPLVKGTISPGHATAFAAGAGLTGSALLYSFCNLPTAMLGAGNILLYKTLRKQ